MEKSHFKASVLYIKIIRQHLEARGLALSDLFRNDAHRLLLSELNHDNNKLPLTAILELWQIAAELCSDHALGLQARKECHITSYGIFAHLLMNSPSLGEAVSLMARYSHVMNDALDSTVKKEKGHVVYSLDFRLSHPAAYHHIEFHLASIVQVGRQLVAKKDQDMISPLRVEFAHRPMAPLKEYEAAFGSEVFFQQEACRMVLSEDVLRLLPNAPNEGMYKMLLQQIEGISRTEGQTPYTNKVKAYFASAQEWLRWPSLQSTAQAIGISASTLKRKLKEEGESYQAICDQVRYRRARRMLDLGGYSISSIAYRLGFTSVAAFSRSFKRWSGMSPSEYLKNRA